MLWGQLCVFPLDACDERVHCRSDRPGAARAVSKVSQTSLLSHIIAPRGINTALWIWIWINRLFLPPKWVKVYTWQYVWLLGHSQIRLNKVHSRSQMYSYLLYILLCILDTWSAFCRFDEPFYDDKLTASNVWICNKRTRKEDAWIIHSSENVPSETCMKVKEGHRAAAVAQHSEDAMAGVIFNAAPPRRQLE